MGTLAGSGVYTYRIHGSVHHKIGSLQTPPDMPAKFAQIYIHDGTVSTQEASLSELNRRSGMFPDFDRHVLSGLQAIIRAECPYVSILQQAYDRLT